LTTFDNEQEPTPTASAVQFPRRELLTMAAAGVGGLLSTPTLSAAQSRYDFSNPADNLQAFVKIGDLTGRGLINGRADVSLVQHQGTWQNRWLTFRHAVNNSI
jgi:hypothetical protein